MSYPHDEPRPLPTYPAGGPGGPRPEGAARPPLTKRMRAAHWMAIDVLVAVGAALGALAVELRPFGPDRQNLPAELVLAVLIFTPVAWRRRGPAAAFGVLVAVAAAVTQGSPALSVLAFLAAAYVLYLVTVVGNRQTGLAALALALVVMALVVITERGLGHRGTADYVPVAFAMIISWMTGYSARQRRRYARTLQQQAASSAVAEERLRIARELHDVVAHSMSVIAVQAGYGQYVIDSNPADARDALGAIQATSRDALEEMRRMLGVLRQQDMAPEPDRVPGMAGVSAEAAAAGASSGASSGAPGAPGTPSGTPGALGALAPGSAGGRPQRVPLAPAPGLSDLDRLIMRTCGAGVQVSVERSGRVRAVPAGVDLSAYRIIQEALTNVVRHAGGGARCTVSIGYGDTVLQIRVTDDGGRSLAMTPAGIGARAGIGAMSLAGVMSVVGAGHGLIGMRERANLCGGEFSAGPLPEGGFQVTATLPLLATPTSMASTITVAGAGPGGAPDGAAG